jgi:hypothetical protein
MNTINITALSFLFLFITAAVQSDVVRITTDHLAYNPSNGKPIQGWDKHADGWTLKNIDNTSLSHKPDAYAGDNEANRKKLRDVVKFFQDSDGIAWNYNGTSIVTSIKINDSANEGLIKIYTNFSLDGDDVQWSFSDIVLTLTTTSTSTAILFVEVQQSNARVVGIERNGDGWQAPEDTFLLPGDYTFAVYAYFGNAGTAKTFSADVSFVSGMIANDDTSVPEPATMLLFGAGIAGTIAAARKPRKRQPCRWLHLSRK